MSSKKALPGDLEQNLTTEIKDFIAEFSLSQREGHVFLLLVNRITTSEDIGEALGLSPNTVSNHLKSILSKTSTSSKTELLSAFIMYSLKRLDQAKLFTKKTKVLIVDDEPEVGEVLADHLSSRGLECLTVNESPTVLHKISEFTPDVILSDIRMPGLDGITLLKEIRKFYKYKPVVLFMTGYSEYNKEECMNEGAADFFTKPVDFDRLFFVIMEHFIETPIEKNRFLRIDDTIDSVINEKYDVRVTNIGFGGVFIPLPEEAMLNDEKLVVGKSIGMSFQLEDNPTNILAKGEIVWVRYNQKMNLLPGVGVKFTHLDSNHREILENYIRENKVFSFVPIGAEA